MFGCHKEDCTCLIFIYRKEKVALKVIRSISKYREAGFLEIKVLQKIMKRDPSGLHRYYTQPNTVFL